MNDQCREVTRLLQDYVDGTLPSRQATAVSLHLQDCPACARRERELRALVAVLASLPRPEPPAGFDDRILAAVPLAHYREMADLRRPRVAVWLEPESLPGWLRSPRTRLAGIVLAAAGAALALGTGREPAWLALVGLVPELLVRLQSLGRRIHAGAPHRETSS